ncbi:MAG: hypothetical protein LBV79_07645 [Candidatus Adiutrix sp.]|jgi:transcriptional regulator with XRE-family HTH domain|nr:hypothetical protein [Candidatus Adiutrix sp.]
MRRSIEEIFRAAAGDLIGQQRGGQARLSKASGVHPPYLNAILKGHKAGSDDVRRRIAEALGYPGRRYEEFLDLGRALLDHNPRPEYPTGSPGDEMADRGFFPIPFSEHMRLAPGGMTIPITEDSDQSRVIVHVPSLGRTSARGLQAFRVKSDDMEPLLHQGDDVLADTRRNDPRQIREGALYILCWDLSDGECQIKRLRWAEKPRLLAVESIAPAYPPIFKETKEVAIIGEVIYSWRRYDH